MSAPRFAAVLARSPGVWGREGLGWRLTARTLCSRSCSRAPRLPGSWPHLDCREACRVTSILSLSVCLRLCLFLPRATLPRLVTITGCPPPPPPPPRRRCPPGSRKPVVNHCFKERALRDSLPGRWYLDADGTWHGRQAADGSFRGSLLPSILYFMYAATRSFRYTTRPCCGTRRAKSSRRPVKSSRGQGSL